MPEYSSEHLRGIAEDWDKRHKVEDWEGKVPEPRVTEFVEKHKDEIGPKILDIGSGQGRHLKYLIEQGYQVTGLELSKKGLEITKKKFEYEEIQPDLVQGDFHRLPFKDESFDTAISVKVLHNNNWAGAEQTFAEIARVLKPGGLFFCMLRSTTNKIPEEGRIIDDRGKTWVRPGKETDAEVMLHDFTLEELHELAQNNSLEIDYNITPPVDERQNEKGYIEPGQWNVTLIKKRSNR